MAYYRTTSGVLFLDDDLTINDNITMLPWNSDFDCAWITKQYNAGKFANVICNGTNPINTVTKSTNTSSPTGPVPPSGDSTGDSTAGSSTKKTTTIAVGVTVPVVCLALLGIASWKSCGESGVADSLDRRWTAVMSTSRLRSCQQNLCYHIRNGHRMRWALGCRLSLAEGLFLSCTAR